MGQTPIYEQLRGERINADVPATGADPQRVDHPGKHHLPAVAPVPAAVFQPPGPGADLDVNRHHLVRAYPADRPAGDAGRAVAVWGPRAGLSRAAHVRHAPAYAASSSPVLSGASRNPAAWGARAGDHGADLEGGGGPRRVPDLNPRPATPAEARFSWFDVNNDAGHSSFE
ncbi:MAG: hypothetical protein ACRDRO_20345 [Pseudonocardiaceae bacterium]